MKNITLFILILIANNLTAQSEKLYRFYDFGIEIDFQHSLFGDDYKFIFPNSFNYKNLNENTLYRIKYSYDEHQNRIALDTIHIVLNEKEMDKIFVLTRNQFNIQYDENLSKYKIPPPPIPYDGLVVSLTFRLGFRGDKYVKELGYPFADKTFNQLNDFIEKLFSLKKNE